MQGSSMTNKELMKLLHQLGLDNQSSAMKVWLTLKVQQQRN